MTKENDNDRSSGGGIPLHRNGLPRFDPEPSGRFACQVLRDAKVKGALIGRVAVWTWLSEPSEHAFTKDVDIAVSRDDLLKLRTWLAEQGLATRELPIGGVNVKKEEGINVDFIDRSKENENLAPLFEGAVTAAYESKNTLVLGGETLFIVPAEHLVVMKISTFERKDEEDAERLLEHVQVDMEKVRALVAKYLGPLGPPRLENLLRTIGHPAARSRQKYNGDATR